MKPESIAKTVAFHTGRKRSVETKRKISEAAKRRYKTNNLFPELQEVK